MSSRITVRPTTSVGIIGVVAVISGLIMIIVGAVTWAVVSQQLSQERITVSQDAPFLTNQQVTGPLTAYAQAQAINDHALDSANGQTYAELAQDDPERAMVMNASFLRASLFTSVVAFGLAAFVMGAGLLFVLVGWALHRSAGGPPIVIDTGVDGPIEVLDQRGRQARGIPNEPTATAESSSNAEEIHDDQHQPETDMAPTPLPEHTRVENHASDEHPAPPAPAPLPPHTSAPDYGTNTEETSAPLRMSRSARALSDQRVRPDSARPSLTGAIPIVGGPDPVPQPGLQSDDSPSSVDEVPSPEGMPPEPVNDSDPGELSEPHTESQDTPEPRPITGAVQWTSPRDRLPGNDQ
ncbi:hypothetical protein [Jonesia quinghaiensis]|uniref:hypothetical protein n=1 Tax=Jonesia quinghaiensis TaxID=262806 RepID=UPI000400CFA2|nr:hypothetical protein [Jonesia quinghaiensis]